MGERGGSRQKAGDIAENPRALIVSTMDASTAEKRFSSRPEVLGAFVTGEVENNDSFRNGELRCHSDFSLCV